MNFIKKLLVVLVVLLSVFWTTQTNAAIDTYTWSTNTGNTTINKNLNWLNWWKNNITNNKLNNFWKWDKRFFWVNAIGWNWIFYTLVNIAQSLKNLFFFLATVFYLIIAIKLIATDKTEEEISKFKKWIIWITLWLMVMQLAYSYVMTLYANSIWEKLAFDLITNIINPFIWLMEAFASFVFLAIAIFAFYRMVTANWKEEEITRSKMSILYAIMWFILIKLARVIVEWVYWKLECKQSSIAWFDEVTISCISDNNASWLVWNILQIINWMNSFIWVITILLIIYAWFNILFSAWDEEKIKKAKSTLIYIVIWLGLLVMNYLLLTFFILPETTI